VRCVRGRRERKRGRKEWGNLESCFGGGKRGKVRDKYGWGGGGYMGERNEK